MSFTDIDEGIWRFVGLAQYQRLIGDQWFWNSLGTTILFTIASTLLHLGIGMFFALLLNERWFSTTLRNIMRGVLILPGLFNGGGGPDVGAAVPSVWPLQLCEPGCAGTLRAHRVPGDTGLALASIIVVNTWKSYPFYMISILEDCRASQLNCTTLPKSTARQLGSVSVMSPCLNSGLCWSPCPPSTSSPPSATWIW